MSRVLLVDDQKIPRTVVAGMLHEAGYEVATAGSGPEGLELARASSPDLVVLDVHMPGMDGFEVVGELKRDPATAHIPVIFLTATAPTDELVVRGLELGAYDFLNKGCSRNELLARVGAMIRIKRSRDELAALARISGALIRADEPLEMCRLVAEQTCDVFRARAGLFTLAQPDEPKPLTASFDALAEPALGPDLAGALLDHMRERAVAGEVVRVDQLGEAGAAAAAAGLASAAVAFVRRDERCALLAVFATEPDTFRAESDTALLHTLASQALIAIENALLHQRSREQAQALERAMGERSRFFASMSHELRTPVNALLGYNQLLRQGFFGELTDGQEEALGKVERSAEHLLELINDVLDISKIEAGKIRISYEPADLAELVRETVTTVELQAADKGLEIRIETPDRVPAVTDPARVRQILLNLLSNAVKFTEEGSVTLRLDSIGEDGDEIVIATVADTGPGIPEADRGRVFEEFEQVEGAASRGGTGLGLPISLRLARMLGGDLALESEVGVGSTFRLELPRRPRPPADEAADDDGERAGAAGAN